MTTDKDKLQALFNYLANIASTKIEPMFNTPIEVTIIVRVPGKPDADVLVSSDTLKEIQAVLDRCKQREGVR